MFQTRRNKLSGFRSQRSMALASQGMACTSQPLATQAGLDVLRSDGNAVDAAIAAVAVLGVVEPFSTGIGGDCFMLVWNAVEQRLYGLNGSGRSPAALSVDLLHERGLKQVPMHGMLPVTIPGAVHAWQEALQRFGSRSFAEALQPAIDYARYGFPLSEIIAHQWNLTVAFNILQHPDALRTFAIDGRAPRLGEIFKIPNLARSLEQIARGGADAFYRGEIAEQIVAFSQANGGVHTRDDFATHTSTWVEPISVDYRGHRLFELPPNGQGLTALIALNILENFEMANHALGSAEALHLRIEAIKLAFADRNRYIGDPEHADVPLGELLAKDYAQGRAALIQPKRALKRASPGKAKASSDTVYLTTADRHGNVVSLINSLYFAFGSGMVAGDTGIALQNRGYGFVTEAGHPNCLAPRKRPFHTIIPAMLFKDGRPLVSFGVMGGDQQAQGHLQVVSNLVDHRLNIQEALDFARFHYVDADRVALEREHDDVARELLRSWGHDIIDEQAILAGGGFGGGQGIMLDPINGSLWGGSDRRKDGCAAGW
ncbi:MAG TPA: gamma-glutamyltransferase [Candidatus Acidoferrales bacterium]|nr:gamma-glutamyltransferase [Candidatus Acidoferrales bacterium]